MKLLSARQAWHDAYTLFMSSPGPSEIRVDFGEKDQDLKIVDGVEAGYIQAAVFKLKPILRSWGMYAYTPIFTNRDEDRVLDYVYSQYIASYPQRAQALIGTRKTMIRLVALQKLATENMRHLEQNGHEVPRHRNGDIAHALSLQPSNYHRDWLPVYEEIMRILDPLPPRALGPVYKVVDDMREKRFAEREANR